MAIKTIGDFDASSDFNDEDCILIEQNGTFKHVTIEDLKNYYIQSISGGNTNAS